MAGEDIEIRIVAVDDASDVIAAASKRISDSCKGVSDSQRGLASAVESTLPPLSASEAAQNLNAISADGVSDSERQLAVAVGETVMPLSQSEQLQMQNAASAANLSSAELELESAQSNLNSAIREYGVNSVQAADALRELNVAQGTVSNLQQGLTVTTQQNTASMRDFTTGLSGVATASFSLYGAYDRVNEAEISLDRSNLMVKTSTKSVEDAQRSLSTAIAEHGANSQEATTASDSLSIAQDRLTLSNERAQQAQENVSKSIMSAALQVIPTSITMVDSLSKAWNNFPDVSALLTKISGGVANVGVSAKTAAIGVAAFMGGFLIADTILGAIPEDMQAIAGALTASIAAIVAATIAWMAFHGTMTVGVAVPIILAAVGAGIAGVKAVAMAEGGVVNSPTYALIGEAGPEIVLPLKVYETQLRKTRTEVFDSSEVFQSTSNSSSNVTSLKDFHEQISRAQTETFESLSRSQNIVKLGSGGVVFEPTYALVGESRPEIVMPLAQYEANREKKTSSTIQQSLGPNVTYVTLTQNFYGDINSPEYVELAAEVTIEKLDERLERRR